MDLIHHFSDINRKQIAIKKYKYDETAELSHVYLPWLACKSPGASWDLQEQQGSNWQVGEGGLPQLSPINTPPPVFGEDHEEEKAKE